jgi:hypothetical protein
MRNLPLPLKLQSDYAINEDLVEDMFSPGVGLAEDTSINFVNRELKLVYPGLTLAEALEVETEFIATRGVERLVFNGRKYIIKDGYSCTIRNTLVSIEVTLIDVTGGAI